MRYEPDHRGAKRLLRTSEMARAVLAAAEVGADAARAAVPRQTGALAASIRVEYAGDSGGWRNDRVEAWIVADTDYAAAVHFGTRWQVAQPFLDAAVDVIEGGA